MHARARMTGLTLIELVIVLAIIGLLLGFGFNGLFSWIGEDHALTTEQALQSQLRFATALGLQNGAQNGPYQVINSISGSNHQIEVCPQAGCGTAPIRSVPVPTTSVITLNGTAFSCIAFDDHGLPAPNVTGCSLTAPANGQWIFTIQDVSHAQKQFLL